MITVAIVVGLTLGALVIVWLSHRLLVTSAGQGPSAGGNAFGGFDVFDPGRARGAQDLKDHDEKTAVAPTPEDHGQPVFLVTDRYGNPETIRLRRPPPD